MSTYVLCDDNELIGNFYRIEPKFSLFRDLTRKTGDVIVVASGSKPMYLVSEVIRVANHSKRKTLVATFRNEYEAQTFIAKCGGFEQDCFRYAVRPAIRYRDIAEMLANASKWL